MGDDKVTLEVDMPLAWVQGVAHGEIKCNRDRLTCACREYVKEHGDPDPESEQEFVDIPLEMGCLGHFLSYLRVEEEITLPQGKVNKASSAYALPYQDGFVRFVWPEWVADSERINATQPKVWCNDTGYWSYHQSQEFPHSIRPIVARFRKIQEAENDRD